MNLVRLDNLRANDKNPRKIRDQRFADLVASLIDFPEMLELRPTVYDEEGLVLGGNMRYRAVLHVQGWPEADRRERIEHAVFHRGLVLDEMGNVEAEASDEQKAAYRAALERLLFGEEMPGTLAAGLTPELKRQFIIKDNAGFGEWDWDELLIQGYGPEVGSWGVEVPAGWGDTSADEDEEPDEDLEGEYPEQEHKQPLPTCKKCPNCGFDL